MHLHPITDPHQWQALHSSLEGPVPVSHNFSLGRIFEQSFKWKTRYFALMQGAEPIAAMPLCFIGHKAVSFPHFSVGGMSQSGMDYGPQEVQHCLKALQIPVQQIELRGFHRNSPTAYTDKVYACLPLLGDWQLQEQQLPNAVKRRLGKALSARLQTVSGGAELLGPFYRLYQNSMHQHGSPPLSADFFRNILQHYRPGRALVHLAMCRQEVLAAGIGLSYQGTSENCWLAVSAAGRAAHAGDLLHREMIRQAIESGCTSYSFGRSTYPGGAAEYKRRWGCSMQTLYWNLLHKPWLYIRRVQWAPRIWRKLPAGLCNQLGPHIAARIY